MAFMTVHSLSLLALLSPSGVVVQARKVQLSQAIRVEQEEGSTLYHAGHQAHHVTRLHRYEQNGVQSMLEEEAKWEEMRKSYQNGRDVKDVHRMRGSSSFAETSDEYQGFVKLSEIQAQGLQDHHRPWTSWLQTGSDAYSESSTKLQELTAAPFSGALLQRFKAHMTEYRQNHSVEAVVATGLSNLNSQYVGPIGVGTTVEPLNCRIQEDSSPMEQESSSLMESIGGFISHTWSNKSGKVTSSAQACTIKDQSKVWVVFDTGSTNIWISSDLCKEGPCRLAGRHMFNHSVSHTFKYPKVRKHFTVQFGTGKLSGPESIEDFHIGPFTVYNQSFAMIEDETGQVFKDIPFEGIVGMAFDRMAAHKAQPFFSSMIKQKALKHNEFAFYFSRDTPSANALFWGGVDKKFYEGDLQYFPVIDPYYWSLKLLNFRIGGDVMLGGSDTYEGTANPSRKWNGPVALVDTGTTFFTAESNIFHKVMGKIPPVACKDLTKASHPDVTITLENAEGKAVNFVLNNKQYMTESGPPGLTSCSPAFMQIDIPEAHGPGMVLGEIFLRHFFAVFDRGSGDEFDAKVAFAKSANTAATLSQLHHLTAGQEVFGNAPPAE